MPKKPVEIQRMFDAIAPTYDMLNHLLSFGLDVRWRKKAILYIEEKRGGTILDIAAGSGDFTIAALPLQPQHIVAADFAVQMLKVFQQKLCLLPLKNQVSLAVCDALRLPFADSKFDVTMVAFGIRNFADRLKSLQEMFRVLKPSGLAIILELTIPKAPIIKQVYLLYARTIVPLIGKIISRHNSAYEYLPTSIAEFPDNEVFLSFMKRAGFIETRIVSLTLGTAAIYLGRKPSVTS